VSYWYHVDISDARSNPMSTTTDRRAVLGALASVPALALPVGAMSVATPAAPEASSPDAALLKLLDEVRAAREHSDALVIRLDKLDDENPPDWPPALVRTDDDVSRFRFDGSGAH
jgi:hypothetical protein